MTKPSVAILSSQTLFRRGLHVLLERQGFHHISEYGSHRELLDAARVHPPGVVIIDLDHEREDTLTLMRAMRHALLDTHIVVIGTPLRQGAADGSFDAEVETPTGDVMALLAATRPAQNGRSSSSEALRQHRQWERITPRQRDVLRWLATGCDNRTLARKLRVSVRAVKAHISALLEMLGLENRTQLALLADRAGLRPPPIRARAA
jgi:DNA-binding NarL/FixJ family response regulator